MARPTVRRSGSSPLTRGKPSDLPVIESMARLIPTHAGKTHLGSTRGYPMRAHPHSRGENSCKGRSPRPAWGSSPLTRGKLQAPGSAQRRAGLIPTHAGKTITWPAWPRSPGAHPHSRGENVTPSTGVVRVEGSSPLTRGKLHPRDMVSTHQGLIPTHAGKTSELEIMSLPPEAHPHSRGENHRRPRTRAPAMGSSPLTRGKRHCRRHGQGGNGLIPTHAGKTRMRTLSTSPSRAHPHSRGENTSSGCWRVRPRGSSPLTRGKLRPW